MAQEKKTNAAEILAALKNFFIRFDFFQFLSMLLLTSIGIIFIYGIGQKIGGRIQDYWKLQTAWFIIGLCSWTFFSFFFTPKKLRLIAPVIYIVAIILLIAVLFQSREINAAKRWLWIGPFKFQPSEFAKTAVILMLSWLLSLRDFKLNRFTGILTVAAVAIPPFLLICVEPDLGTAAVIIPITFFILFIGGLSWRWILAATVAICIIIPAGYPFLKEYQKERIRTFLDPERDPRNKGWNSMQALLAVGSGGLYGKGFMQGTQHSLGFLPQTVSNTDFIFSVIGEESGFIGCSTIIALYAILILSLLRTAAAATDPFGKYIAAGTAGMIFAHSFVNIGMTIRLLPVTGLPLPFISYGGTFLLNTLTILGMANSAYFHRKKED